MPGGKKSRSGCSRCKEKRLKCDETKPACQRCTRVQIICPGYQTRTCWSTKHEVHKHIDTDSPNQTVIDEISESVQEILSQTRQDQEVFIPFSVPPVFAEKTLSSVNFLLPDLYSSTTCEPLDSNVSWNSFALPMLDKEHHEIWNWDHALQPWEEHIEQEDIKRQAPQCATTPARPAGLRRRNLQSSTVMYPPIVQTDHALIEYYFKEVAVIYSCYDGHMNPFRSDMARLWTSSSLIAKTLQSMAAACLAPSYPHLAREGFRLRREVLRSNSVETADADSISIRLMTMIMLGQTAGWHNPHDLGLEYYRQSKALLQTVDTTPLDLTASAMGKDIDFFQKALGYWETLLAYVIPHDELQPLTELPIVQQSHSLVVEPHPWALNFPGLLALVRRVGQLVLTNRKMLRKINFWRRSDLAAIDEAISNALDLEQQLTIFEPFPISDTFDPKDDTTPIWHLEVMSQVYRMVALIMIYRVFPDIQTMRMRSKHTYDLFLSHDVTMPIDMENSPIERDKDLWLRQLALRALDLVRTIPLESHTRCIQPFPLIVLSCEIGQIGNGVYDRFLEATTDGRKFIHSRLEAFQYCLPPKPAQSRLELVQEIWRIIDSEQDKSTGFWLNVVLERKWQFLFG